MDDYLSKWLEGDSSSEELKKNIGSEDAVKYQQIIDEVDKWVPDNSERLFDPKLVINQPKKGKIRSINSLISYSVAASLVVAVASYLIFFNSSSITTYKTGIAEVKEILLPDGKSKVTLAPSSEISVNEDHWDQPQVAVQSPLRKENIRKLKLKGKAFFEVAKGNSFVVKNLIGSVEVLGTTFEVDEFDNGMNVICFEGKVKATVAKSEVIVNGGNGFLFYDGKWEDRILIEDSRPSWLQKETKFDNAPLTQVIITLEKLYEVTFDTASINMSRRFTGTVPNDKIDVALRIVFDPFEIDYIRKQNIIYLTD